MKRFWMSSRNRACFWSTRSRFVRFPNPLNRVIVQVEQRFEVLLNSSNGAGEPKIGGNSGMLRFAAVGTQNGVEFAHSDKTRRRQKIGALSRDEFVMMSEIYMSRDSRTRTKRINFPVRARILLFTLLLTIQWRHFAKKLNDGTIIDISRASHALRQSSQRPILPQLRERLLREVLRLGPALQLARNDADTVPKLVRFGGAQQGLKVVRKVELWK